MNLTGMVVGNIDVRALAPGRAVSEHTPFTEHKATTSLSYLFVGVEKGHVDTRQVMRRQLLRRQLAHPCVLASMRICLSSCAFVVLCHLVSLSSCTLEYDQTTSQDTIVLYL